MSPGTTIVPEFHKSEARASNAMPGEFFSPSDKGWREGWGSEKALENLFGFQIKLLNTIF